MPSQRLNVLIVGAGAAGLAAARELAEHGLSAHILEARDRAGGRINTRIDAASKLPVELGPEFIHGRSPHIFELLDKHNLPIYEISGEHLHLKNGMVTDNESYDQDFDKIFSMLRKDEGQDRSFAEFLNEITFADDITRRRTTTYVEDYNAADARVIGIRGLADGMLAADKIYGEHFHRFVNGYSSLVQNMLADLPVELVDIDYETIVRQLTWSAGNVTIDATQKTASSDLIEKNFSAEKVIITVPLNVLKAAPEHGGITFSPSIDQKRDCLSKIHMGNAIRLTLVFRSVFWQNLTLPVHDGSTKPFFDVSFIFAESGKFSVLWTYYPLRAPLIVAWVSGRNTDPMLTLTAKQVESMALESLAGVLKLSIEAVRSELVASHMYDWLADPFSRGAYSYLGVGGVPAQKELAEPIENTLFFAGEATATDGHIGTVHGAIASGKRAAQQIVHETIITTA